MSVQQLDALSYNCGSEILVKKTSDVFKFQALGWACVCIGLMAVAPAFGGTADIGGGSGVVCRDGAGAVTSVRLFDLYEGSDTDKLNIPDVDLSPDAQVKLAFGRLSYAFSDGVKKSPLATYERLLKIFDNADPGKFIDAPKDQGLERAVLLPRGCSLEGIGYREKKFGKRFLTVVPDLFDRLTKTHQAAFMVHEAIYSYFLGRFGEEITKARGTIDIRRLTAVLFASHTTLADVTIAANFLFGDKLYLDESQNGVRATLIGRENPLDIHLDELSPDSTTKFYCAGNGTSIASSATITNEQERNWKLELKETNACMSRVVIQDLRALLQVNGRDVLEVTRSTALELVFLKDNPQYREFSERARYPHALRPAGR